MISSPHMYALGQFEGQTDVGSVNLHGSCDYDGKEQVYTISCAGANIWGDQDSSHFE
jgi:TolB protein